MRRFCLMLDLRSDPSLIEEYLACHRAVPPEIFGSIRDAGVLDMQIYNLSNRLFMIMDTVDDFTLAKKAAMDSENPKVLEGEALMSRFQQVDVDSNPTTRWMEMKKVFQLI